MSEPITTATKITIGRLALIPVFVVVGTLYGWSCLAGEPNDALRIAAVIIFFTAAASDSLDGYIARKYNQMSKLGAILDPIADKALMMSALLVISLSGWDNSFPWWYVVIVITRDITTIVGSVIVKAIIGKVDIVPHWTGKRATFFQIVTYTSTMLLAPPGFVIYPLIAAAVLTFTSGVGDVTAGIRQIKAHRKASNGQSN